MKKRGMKKMSAFFAAVVMIISSLSTCFYAAAAANTFESKISVFPDSYKPYLRELHEKYPDWTFEAVETGLDWSEAMQKENTTTNPALISTAAGEVYMSRESSDYNPTTQKYTQYDAGFVRVNSLALSYYMDPRNFLNENGIFMFEKLSFPENETEKDVLAAVNEIIAGSFMSNSTKITYYDTNGKKKTLNTSYAQVIFDAGKKYNVNPCYLASTIISEVGKSGSNSVTGTKKGYEGYYNFYNIGAYSSSEPITKGLEYAKSGTTYSRPWTDPKKAIMGGAEFIASSYIAKGQDTGYFQRYNVAPYSKYTVYTHQYMTDILGEYRKSVQTYSTYKSLSITGAKRIFSIPVYENMPAAKQQATSFKLSDTKTMTATVATANGVGVRTQPNTKCDRLTVLPYGTSVKITDTVMNSSGNYSDFVCYPYWYKISATVDGTAYSGYACAEYFDLDVAKTVTAGKSFTLSYTSSPSEKPSYVSDDSSVIKVNSDGTLSALKEGKTVVKAYTSTGLYRPIKISVIERFDKVDEIFTYKKTVSSVQVKWSAVEGATGYQVYRLSSSGKYELVDTVESTSYTFKNLKAGESLTCKVRAYGKINGKTKYGTYSSILSTESYTKKLSSLAQSTTTAESIKLKCNSVNGATSYVIYKLNSSTGKYVKVGESETPEYTLTQLSAATKYNIRMTVELEKDGKTIEYAGNDMTVISSPKAPTNLKVSDTTGSTVEITWDEVPSAEKYAVYKLGENGYYSKVATVDTNSYKETGLTVNTKVKYKVKAYLSSNGINCYSDSSSALTAYTGPSKVKNLTASDITENSATLKWSKNSKADGYYIYKYNPTTKKYTYVGSTVSNSYTVKKLSSATEYYYSVRSYSKVNSVKYKGSYCTSVRLMTLPAQVTGLKFSSSDTSSYTLKWTEVSGAYRYQVYKLNSSGKYVRIATVKTNSYKITDQKSATEAKYKVRAYAVDGEKKLYGSYSTVLTATTRPNDVTSLAAKKTSKGYTLSWKKAARADGYMVYSYNTSTGKYVLLKTTTSTSYAVTPKKTTKYKVVSYVTLNSTKYKSSGKTISVKIG